MSRARCCEIGAVLRGPSRILALASARPVRSLKVAANPQSLVFRGTSATLKRDRGRRRAAGGSAGALIGMTASVAKSPGPPNPSYPADRRPSVEQIEI